jgi:uncharacterized protein
MPPKYAKLMFWMLLRLRFSNVRSFRDEQDLSLIAGPFNDKPEIPRHRAELIKESVLPVAAIYGANASGKTNVLHAISFISEAVSFSHSRWKPDGGIPYQPFLFSGDPSEGPLPAGFEIEFLTGGIRYRYGFRVNNIAVLEEWLHAYPKGKKQIWFHRVQGNPISFSTKLAGENRTIENLTRKNSLFLSAAAQNNHEALLLPYQWITGLLFVIGDRSLFIAHTAKLCKSTDYLDEVSRLISIADFGVTGLKIELRPVPDEALRIYAALKEFMNENQVASGPPAPSEEIRLLHRFDDRDVPFHPQQESQGTLIYLGLLGPVVKSLKTGTPLIVDELDGSLHTLLCMQLVHLFNNPKTNPRWAQLIFNTHDTNLLSSGLLRRDQIWFTEKKADGSTDLFPLSDFKLRRTDKLESGYLMGRYGAIPFINSEALLSRFENAEIGTR